MGLCVSSTYCNYTEVPDSLYMKEREPPKTLSCPASLPISKLM